jgi:prepilin-type N-terminal cleavage/methylation domain-containing protein
MTPFLRPQPSQTQSGYTLVEMVIVVAIFGLLFATTQSLTRGVLDREDFNGLALGLSTWLEAIQRGAQRTTGGCTVTFTSGVNSTAGLILKPGDILARVTPSNCSNESVFVIPSFRSDGNLTAKISPSAISSITFTPRGTLAVISRYTATYENGPTITFTHSKTSLVRCVRVTHTSGMITLGSNNNGSACDATSFDGSI